MSSKSEHERLGITFAEYGALMGTREMLKLEVLAYAKDRHSAPKGEHTFNMNTSCKGVGECGTVSCIGGTMGLIMGMTAIKANDYVRSIERPLERLFYPGRDGCMADYDKITPAMAIEAIDNFLKSGRPDWETVAGINEILDYSTTN